ncbi:hypothetical protein J2D73_18755 [Acetobacter sacchari]|uniref:Uncharacterized protein n=1 Tax=Acetobacter sacchari TaxID=2661687 RepID=A0ABS3M125_9PROT|nr:hypothetical protein [Acetobacter sacchari]MBO1361827.1 hypothetical protein [Acetobacter sacchari]
MIADLNRPRFRNACADNATLNSGADMFDLYRLTTDPADEGVERLAQWD